MPGPAKLEIELLGEGYHAKLRDRVRPANGAAHQARHGGGVHNMPLLAASDHPRDETAHTVDDAPEVHIDHPTPVFRRELPHVPRAAAHASVVAEHVHSVETAVGALGQRFDLVRPRHVGPLGQHLHALRGDRRLGHGERLRLNIPDHDVHASVGESLSHSEAESTRTSRDNRHLPFERLHW